MSSIAATGASIPAERARRLLAGSYALARPAATIRYSIATPAGECGYDTPMARAIVASLAAGPRSIAGLAAAPGLLEDLLTLCAAGDAMPVESGRQPVIKLNRAIWQRLGGPEEISWLALPCGAALETDRGLLRALRDGAAIDDGRYPGWRDLLASHAL